VAIGTITEWDHVFDPTPPVGVVSTASLAYLADTVYVVQITQARLDSVEPPTPGVTGMGVTWADVSGADTYWDSIPASMRKTSTFWGRPTSGGTDTIDVTYATDPADVDVLVLEVPGGLAPVQYSGVSHTAPSGTLAEPVTLATPGSSNNAVLVFVAANVDCSATARLEMDADAGGDHDWTSFTALGSGSSPTGTWLAGHTMPATADLTPGWIHTAGPTAKAYLYAIEIEAAPETTGVGVMFCGVEATFKDVVLPSGVNFLIGSSIDLDPVFTATTHPAATAAFEADLGGAHLQIARRYDGDLATSFATGGNAANDFSQDEGVRHRFVSMKAPSVTRPTQAEWATFLATVPNDNDGAGTDFISWVTAWHEPEDNMTPAQFRTLMGFLHAAWVADGSNAWIKPSLCLMSWNERDPEPASGTSSADLFPTTGIADFTLWIDSYDPNSNRTLQQQTEATVTLWKAAGGTVWGVGETGTKRTGADLANWISTGIAWCQSDPDCVGWIWYHSAGGTNGPWWLTDADGLAAMAAEMALTA